MKMTTCKLFAITISLSIYFLTLVFTSCSKPKPVNDEYVLQVKNTGLRKDVFIRRYQLTGEYGKNAGFSSDMLKSYISDVLEPNYLLVQHAYDLGLHKTEPIAHRIKEYRINLLADNHPIKYEKMIILKNDLRDFYEKRSITYDVEIFQTPSYLHADSIRASLQEGNKFDPPKEYMASFPRYLHIKSLVFGEGLHPELYPVLRRLNEGDISDPVYAASIWWILKINKIVNNKSLPAFEDIEQELLAQAQAFIKYNQQKQLVDSLFSTYQVSHNTDFYAPLIDAYTPADQNGWIDKSKVDKTLLDDSFLKINHDAISLSEFITAFNQTSQFKKLPSLVEQDLAQFIHEYSAQYCLYLDAVDKGVDHDVLIQDQLQNKEHRILLSAYLNDVIMNKIDISDQEVLAHFQANPVKWQGSFESVALNVKSDLRSKKLTDSKNAILGKLRKKYHVKYNDDLLHNIAEDLTRRKKAADGTE